MMYAFTILVGGSLKNQARPGLQRQPFIVGTLGITYWAARKTKSASDFYTAGGGISGFQNGLAIAGDYMSAAAFLGVSGLIYMKGYDGVIYAVSFLVGWPIILFFRNNFV